MLYNRTKDDQGILYKFYDKASLSFQRNRLQTKYSLCEHAELHDVVDLYYLNREISLLVCDRKRDL